MSQLTSAQRLVIWTERLERFQSTDLSVVDFCRREAVSVPSFYNWKKRLNQKSISKRRRRDTNPGDAKFVPVVVNTAAATTKLNLPGGASIDLPTELESELLTKLIAVVIEVTECRNRHQGDV
jgi:hypothetical protein